MKRAGFLIFLLFFSACSYDDLFPPIKGYDSSWDFNLSELYPSPSVFVDYLQTSKILELADGSLVFVSTFGSTDKEIILTKLSAQGVFIKDMKLKTVSSAVSNISQGGNILLLHADTLSTYDSDLNLISNHVMNFGNEYQQDFGINGTGIFRSKYENNQQFLVNYDLTGNPLWKVPFKSLGCGGSSVQVSFNDNNMGLLSVSDTIRISNVYTSNGSLIWNKQFLKTAIQLDGYSVSTAWTSSDIVYLISLANEGKDVRVTTVGNDIQSKTLSADLKKGSIASKAVVTKDQGILIGILTNHDTDVANFRLVKLDQIKRIVWEGAFYQVGLDWFADMIEFNNGAIVTVTSKGHILTLKPTY